MWKTVMLSAVPEKASTLVSCRLEDWANPNARIKFRKKYLQVFFRVLFFLDIHCLTWLASDQKYVRHCFMWGTVDVIMLSQTRLFFSYLSHANFGPGRDTQDRLGRGFAPFFLQHKDMHLWTADLRWGESAPYMQNLAPLGCWEGRGRKKSSSLTPQVLLGVRGIYLFFFFHSVFCLLLCMCWRLGAFQKIQTPLPREHTSRSTVQHRAGCRTLFVFLVHWAGIFSFHASSITCCSNSKNLYHAHMNTNNLNSHFCFWKFIIIEVRLIKQLYFWNFSQNNQVMALPN